MQATPAWTPPAGTLGGIVNEAHERAATLRQERGALERAAAAAGPVPSFAGALRQSTVSVVAEVKRRSPSKGAIGPDLDPMVGTIPARVRFDAMPHESYGGDDCG